MASYGESMEHIVTRPARIHIEFEGIHPFIDGNVAALGVCWSTWH